MARDDLALEPWDVDPAAFPVDRSDAEQLAFLVRFAVLAPSGHNTQPWSFRMDGDALEVWADRTRGLPVVDPDDRELTISCGAALGMLEHAARGLGIGLDVVVLPDGPDADLVATVRIAGRRPPTVEDRARMAAIPERVTNRQPFEARPVPDELQAALRACAAREGCWLAVVTDDRSKSDLAELVAIGDRSQMDDRRFRRELASWVGPNRSRRPDGIRGYGFGFADLMSRAGPFVIRTFDLGNGQAAKDRDLATGAPLLAVLGTVDDGVADWVAAGRALVAVLLQAQVAAVSASHLNQPIEVEALRPRVAAVVGHEGEHPQILLRIGYGSTPRREPRRAAADVLVGR